MRIIDRYILKSIMKLFFLCLLTFLLLYVIIDVFSNLDDILKQHVPVKILLQYYLTYLPVIFVQVSPVSSLLATLYTFGKLNRDNEIVAMRSSGLSIYQISKTVIIFGAIVSIFVFLVNDKIVPKAIVFKQKIKQQMESGSKDGYKKQETIYNLAMYGMKNRLFFVAKFSPDTKTLEDITVLEHDEQQDITKKIVAKKGVYAEGIWKFYNSITYAFDKNGQIKGEPQFLEEEIMTISETPKDFLTQRQQPDIMTIAQLKDYLWKLSKSGAKSVIRKIKVELYQRFSLPLTNIIIVLLGIPFALKMHKRATGISSLGISIVMGFLYYVLNAVSLALGMAGKLPPFLSAFLSHIIAFSFSIYMINKLP